MSRDLGPYRIDLPLGEGGMGEVFRATDTRLHRTVAVKLLRGLADEKSRKRFAREAQAASALNHPHICTVYDVGEAGGQPYLDMEYLEGETLRARLNRGSLPIPEIVAFATQIAEALDAAHAIGIVHRDIKPANIFITRRGLAKVMDFGIAFQLRHDIPESEETAPPPTLLTAAGAAMGTIGYMSPEQARGEPLDGRSDLFSLGDVLYEMATGQRPFRGSTDALVFDALLHHDPVSAVQLRPELPPALNAIIVRLLEKDPQRRTPSTAALLGELRALTAAGPQPPEAPAAAGPGASRSLPAPARSRARILTRATLAIAALVAGGWWLETRDRAPMSGASAARPANNEAYDLILRARYRAARLGETDLDEAIALVERAIELEPGFGPAHALLAYVYGLKSNNYRADEPVWREKGYASVQRALALDSSLPEAHVARGLLLWTHSEGFPSREALSEYRQALDQDPKLSEAWNQRGIILFHIGHLDAGLRAVEQAAKLDPGNINARFRPAPIRVYQQRYQDAITILQRVPRDSYPSQWAYQMIWSLISLERLDEAATEVDRYLKANAKDQGGVVHAARAMLRLKRGDRTGALADIVEATKGEGFVHFHHTAYSIGAIYAQMGDLDQAQRWIERAANDGFPCYTLFATDPYLEKLRETDRFKTFLKNLRAEWQNIPGEE